MVWDLEADSCIYRFRERQLMRPASTMKLVTAITALDKLGGSYQFKTTLKYTGTIDNGVLKGDVYCIGGMDPRFNNDDMTAFVTSLKDMGVDSIHGSIYADRSMKDEDLLGEGWCWDDDNPVLSPLVFGRKDIFMERFLAKLKDAGIFYAGSGTSVKRCPASAFTICTRFHTMDQILHKMMKDSDNLYAESMYYQIASSTGNRPASAKSARNVQRQLVRKIGLDPGGQTPSLCLPGREHPAASQTVLADSWCGWNLEEENALRFCSWQCEGENGHGDGCHWSCRLLQGGKWSRPLLLDSQ